MNITKVAQAMGLACTPRSGSNDADNSIGDTRFASQLKEVQDLKRFLFEEKVKFNPEQIDSIDLGPLNNLRYRPHGRPPTADEWKLLDVKLSGLASYITDELRQKIRIRELGVYFGTIPLLFLVVAVAAIIYYFLYSKFLAIDSVGFTASYLGSLVVWTITQGGLGACAFLGTRVAIKRAAGASISEALQEGADITDRSVLKIRILLGCLFGFLLGLPFSALALDNLLKAMFSLPVELNASGFAFIVVPFMVGFSTNLVLAILDRCVVSIRTFFGTTDGK
jgi:hypothetical protein